MRLKQCIFALMAMLLCAFSANAQGGSVAKIGNTEYTTFADAMAAANATTGNVDVEVYGAVEFVDGMELNGSYTAITFTGKSEEAKITINQTAGGDYLTAHGKTVAFVDLILAKANPAWSGNSGHMGNYFSIQGGTVTYTDCTFPNGACTNTGTAVYNNCTFQNSSEYGLWVYDDALVTVNGGTIDSKKGIKVYSEGEQDVTSTLTVKNATFTENVTAKPAVAVGYAQSITLIGNTYNNTTAHVELDSGSDADCEGITFVAEDSEGNDISSELTVVDRSNSSAPCGVLVGDKIYTTVTEAAAEATEGSTVTLLYNSTEEVELPEGVTLNKNGFTADNVTVATSGVAQVGENVFTTVLEALQYAINNNAAELKILCDVREKMTTDFDLIINADLTITADAPVKVEFYNDGTSYDFAVGSNNNNTLTIGENVHFDLVDRVIWLGYWDNNVTVVVNGYLGGYQIWHGANTVVNGTLDSHGEAFIMRRDATLTANEGAKVNANYFQIYSGHIVAENATITAGLVWVNNNHNYGNEGTVSFELDNTEFTSNGEVKIYAGEGKIVSVTLENSSLFDAKGVVTLGDNVKVVADATSSIQDANGSVVIPVAKIGDVEYTSLEDAFEAAAATAEATITLIEDLTIESDLKDAGKGYFNVADGKKVTLDLGGKTITATDNSTGNFILFYSYGEFTIKNGTVVLTATNDRDWNAQSTIVLNRGGIFNCESGTYTHNGGTDMAFVFDNSGNYYGDATTNIKGGELTSTYIAIRNRMEQNSHGASGKAILNVTGGKINGTSLAVWAQAASISETAPATGAINVSGGEVGLIDTPRSTGAVSMTTISGGTVAAFKGEAGELTVKGGTIGNVEILTAAGEATDYAITADGVYAQAVAKIGEQGYETLAAALTAAQDGDVVTLVWADGDAPIAMNGSVFGKNVTITGTATVDWSKGFLFVGRGGEGNATVTFDGASLTSASDQDSTGIHVSGREKDTNNKYDGTLVIKNSTIELDYLINKNTMSLDNSTLTVKNGFSIGGRPASETESGADATATISLANNSKVIVNDHNGMGLGYEAIGVMNIDATSTFEATQAFLVTAKGTMNVAAGGAVSVNGTLTVNGTLVSAGNIAATIAAGDNATIEISGGVYTQDVNEWCVENYAALPDLNGNYVVGVKPTATVNNLGMTTIAAGDYSIWNGGFDQNTEDDGDMPLSFVMQFLADQDAEDMATSPYADWYGDFVITFTGIENGSFTADGCYLAGHYGSFGWVKVPVDGMTIEEGARYPVMLGVGLGQKYDYICSSVEDFKCALYLTPEILEANPNIQVKLELAVVDNSKGGEAAKSALVNNENVYSVTDYTYDAEDFVVKKDPEVVDGKIEFVDGEFNSYTNDTDIEDVEITYKRTIDSDWNALYVPFAIPASELLADFDIAYINDVRETDADDDGELDGWQMELIKIKKETAVLRANHPYFIRSKSADYTENNLSLTLTTTLYKATVAEVKCSSMYSTYTIKGLNELRASTEFGDADRVLGYDKGETTWGKMADGYSLKPFRFYLTITNHDGSPVVSSSAQMSIVVRDEDGTTGIGGIYGDENGETVIFDLYGRRVLEPEKGNIYIINGKKVLVK